MLVVTAGVAVYSNFPFTPEAAARMVSQDLATGDVDSPVWGNSPSNGTLGDLTSALGEFGLGSREVNVVSVSNGANVASATLEWRWDPPRGEFGDSGSSGGVGVPSAGSSEWTYRVEAELHRQGAVWKADFNEGLVHPKLDKGEVLSARAITGARGRILGQGDEVLMSEGVVIDVGVQPSKMTDEEKTIGKLKRTLDIDAEELTKRIEGSKPDAFVPVITLRRDDYELAKADIYSLPGTVFRERSQSLGRSKGFAAATLGSVGEASAEDLANDPGRLIEGSEIGKSGMQQLYDGTLRSSLGLEIVTRSSDAGGEVEPVWSIDPAPGGDVRTTLDVAVQTAADDAARTAKKPAAIVAMRPSDGEVLAVANHDPAGAAWDRALTGQYPPGSVFKVASALAMVDGGVKESTTLDCPKTTVVSGKRFKNSENHVLGSVPFEESFAQSCNTAFVNSASKVPSADLSVVAMNLGMGPTDIGTDSFMADVPDVEDPVEHAAATIGQGKVLATPLAIATMTSSVAAERTVRPRIVVSESPAGGEGGPGGGGDPAGEADPGSESDKDALSSKSLDQVQNMMRRTVTGGTAKALSVVPGGPVYAKTGTAEYGNDKPPRTHSWLTAYQGDLAVAVLVEDGGFGAEAAVPVAKRFFQEVH